ncbi:hypothetical protein FACS18949_12790 [Clostridia bacterium]|nr:hypothetical protein FACS18949_12790 [Clostridia bacterium]
MLEIYQKAKEAAYRVLINGGVSAFPFDIVRIAIDNGITILKDKDVKQLRDGEAAAVFYDGAEWFVVYDETIPSREYKRHVLAHELGRKALNQPMFAGFPSSTIHRAAKRKYAKIDIPVEEKEAEAFARHLLAPLVILRGLNITDSRDIARISQIPIEIAEQQAEVLEHYNLCNVDLTPLERQLYEQFKPWIEQNRL